MLENKRRLCWRIGGDYVGEKEETMLEGRRRLCWRVGGDYVGK